MRLWTATTVSVRDARLVPTVDPLRIVASAAARVHRWAATAEGSRRTHQALESLDRGAWRITHRVPLPNGGHADHLAIGPSGLYLLDSRAWDGVVTVDHKGATITPEGRPAEAWTARGQHCSLAPAAAALGRTVSTGTGSPMPAPRAVVVVWASFPERVAVSGGITYVVGGHLAEWLSEQPPRPGEVAPRSDRENGRPVPVRARPLNRGLRLTLRPGERAPGSLSPR